MADETPTDLTPSMPLAAPVVDPRNEFLTPLRELVNSAEWSKVYEDLSVLEEDYRKDILFLHLNGVLTTMNNLKNSL